MKKSVKLFALAFVSLAIFSCTTDEYDAALEESVKVTENIQNAQFRYGDNEEETEEEKDSIGIQREETDPIIIVKRDN